MSEGSDDDYLEKAKKDYLERAQREEQIKELMRSALDSEAYERIMNIKASNEDLYMQFASLLVQLVQSGQVKSKITDKQLKSLLLRFTSKHEPTINIKHK